MSILSNIKSPEDVKALAPQQLQELAAEIRKQIIDVTSKKGGHVSPNLGVVELTIALHRVFSTPKDKITNAIRTSSLPAETTRDLRG